MAAVNICALDSNWSWKQRNPSVTSVLDELKVSDSESTLNMADAESGTRMTWRQAQTFPSEVHVELLKAGLIPDPYVGFNEHRVQWIGEVEWLYKCTFQLQEVGAAKHALLEFLGLDTICDIYLNGEKVASVDNMFQTHRLDVSLSSLKPENTLFLHFKSAAAVSRSLEEKYGRVRAGSTNLGDPSRVYVRKAQYDWRWDWGPELMTCGVYRPVSLITYTTRILDVFTKATVTSSGPVLQVDLDLEGSPNSGVKAKATLKDLSGALVKSEDLTLKKDSLTNKNMIDWKLNDAVKLWWPTGYGEQNLYILEVQLLDSNDTLLDEQSKRIGFRTVKLIQEELAEADQYGQGTTFLFEINGVRMFIGGSNWIPADNFLTTLKADRYRAWLTLLRDGNQNMVRLWGGGVYEPDVFYDTCDELGILVWQDFQFACGVYPAHEEFLVSVKKEAEDNVKRLRHHAAIALFCGNNEDYQMILQWGDVKDFPAIKIYEELLPSVVDSLTCSSIPYHRGSPYGGEGWDTADPTVGDVHQWHIWGGKELQYHEYDKMGGRFVSEFGMPSMPSMETVKYWSKEEKADSKQMYFQSPLMAQHCKAGLFERRFAIPMNENFRVTEDLETAVYNTQIMQAEAVGYAYQSWRRQWKGPGKQFTSGAIVWQLNDCWPVTSWAIVDYFLRPKPAYYAIKRQMASITVGIFRTVTKNKANDRPRQFYEFGAYQSHQTTLDIWGVNALLDSRRVKLEVHCIDLISNWSESITREAELKENQATELLSFPCPAPPNPSFTGFPEWTTTNTVVVSARLIDISTGEVLARYVDWPQPYRYLDLPDPELMINVDEAKGIVTLEAKKPAKGVFLSVGEEGDSPVKWSDNGLDLFPGDPQSLSVHGLEGRKVRVAYLGSEKAKLL